MRQKSSSGRTSGGGDAKPKPPGDPVDTGLRLLGRRDHSREELRRKLSRRGHEKAALEEAIRRIHEVYGLDDRRFARSYVFRRAATRGPLAIAGELAARGIDRAAAEAALAEYGAAEQLSSAIRLAHRLTRSGPDLGYRELVDKVGAKLLRRGFSTTIARAACRAVAAEAAQLPED